MIRLSRRRDGASIPADFRGAKLVDKHIDLIGRFFAAASAGKPIAFDASKWKSAKAKLRVDTARKCAYCEAPTSSVAHGDVEHFRPKSVYWWMAYRFDNYLFSCQICNQIYKGNEFPISGPSVLSAPAMPGAPPVDAAAVRMLASMLARDATALSDADCIAEWIGESADLVHPYLEDPGPLFVYEADESNEEMWLRAASGDRAARAYEASNTYLGLNREELRKQRYQAFEILAVLKASYDDPGLSPATRRRIARQFAKMRQASFPFAGMNRFFLSGWGV